MTKKVLWLLVSCLMILSLLMASCGTAEQEEVDLTTETEIEEKTETKEETKTEEKAGLLSPEVPKYGGIYNLQIVQDPSGWDYAYTSLMTSSMLMGEEMMMGDWKKGPAGTNECDWTAGFGGRAELLTGCLSESWEMPDDETVVYHIRPGIHFWNKPPTNGREYTAEDAAWNIDRHFSSKTSYLYRNYTPAGYNPYSIKALDKYTLELKVVPEMQGMVGLMVCGEYLWQISPDVVQTYGDAQDWKNFCGTGPFMLTDYVAGSFIKYDRNPNYWQTDPLHPENQLPYLDGIKVLIIPDESTQQAAFRTAKIDYMGSVSWEDAELITKANPEVVYMTRQASPYEMLWGRMDKQELPFKDVRVRYALNLAINNQEIIDEYYRGRADMLGWPYYNLPVFEPIYTPLEEQPEVVQELFTYNPEKARQLLTEAGYPDGFNTEIVCRTTAVDFLSIIKEYFAAINVNMEIKPVESGVFTSIMFGRQHNEMIYQNENPTLPFRMLAVRKESSWAPSFFEHERTREAYETIGLNIGKNDDIVIQTLKEIGPFILEQCPGVFPPVPHQYFMWWPWLQNFYGASGGGGYFTPDQYITYIWVDPALKKSLGH